MIMYLVVGVCFLGLLIALLFVWEEVKMLREMRRTDKRFLIDKLSDFGIRLDQLERTVEKKDPRK